MTGRAEHARHPRREVITTPIFHIRMPSVGSQGDPPAAEPGCDPRREDGSGTGRRGRHAGPEAAACLRGRSAPLPAASVLELAPRARHAVWRCIPCDAHPAPSRPPRRRRETQAVTKPHGEAPPPVPGMSRQPALPWKPPPSTPRGSRVGLGAPPARGTRAPQRSPAAAPGAFPVQRRGAVLPQPSRDARFSCTCR